MDKTSKLPDWADKAVMIWIEVPERQGRPDYESWQDAWRRLFGRVFDPATRVADHQTEVKYLRYELYQDGAVLAFHDGKVASIRVPPGDGYTWPVPADIRRFMDDVLKTEPDLGLHLFDPGVGRNGFWTMVLGGCPQCAEMADLSNILNRMDPGIEETSLDFYDHDDLLLAPLVVVQGRIGGWPCQLRIGAWVTACDNGEFDDGDDDDEDYDDPDDSAPKGLMSRPGLN